MYAVLMMGLLFTPQHDDQKLVNKQVSDYARKFYTAYENGELDTILTMSSIPWYHDGQSIHRSQDLLRIELKKFIEQRDIAQGKRSPEVMLVANYGLMKQRMPAKDRELLEQVVRDDDYLALVILKPSDTKNKKTENVVLLVRVKDGKATAIGVKHTQ